MPDADEFMIQKDLSAVQVCFGPFSCYPAESQPVGLISRPSTEIHPMQISAEIVAKMGSLRAFSACLAAAALASGKASRRQPA